MKQFLQNFWALSRREKTKKLAKWAAWAAGAGLVLIVGVFIFYMKDLPDPNKVNARQIAESSKIFDRTGEHVLYEIHGEEKRTLIKFSDMPDTIKYATIALEDQDFYSHHGIKLTSIMRAVLKDVLRGGAAQGGSTITQQFVKNSLLTSEKSISRKVKEVILSLEIEVRFSKDEILAMYLNEIPYGSNAYGIEAAAQTFFGKPAKELSLDEAAMIAALPQAPSRYSPYGSYTEQLKARQELALTRMANLGYITEAQAKEAKAAAVFAKVKNKQENISAPHFVMYIKDYLEEKYGQNILEQGGLNVFTTLDWDKQQIAERVVREGVEKNKSWNASNASLVALDPKTSQVLAMVGSKDYFDKTIDGNVNVAIRERQPGSSFKPYVYLAAFTKGYTPETMLFDVPTNFSTDEGKDYAPQNYDGKFRGPLQMKEALAQSLNIPAVKTLYLAGPKYAIELAKRMGITGLEQPDRYGLSLVLGGGEVKLLDHVNAFGTLATGGVYRSKTAILKIEDKDGKVLEEYKSKDGARVVEEKYVAMLDHIMSTNEYRTPVFGGNSPLRFDNRPVAAKTGTTNEFRDGWTMGFTPSLAVGVWAGNNDNSPMKAGADGVNVAAPIWRAFLNEALANYPIEQFPKYEKDESITKPMLSGKLDVSKDLKVCKIPGKDDKYCLVNQYCAEQDIVKQDFAQVHNILYYVKLDDPRGDYPTDPQRDPQYKNWEKGVQEWYKKEKKGKDGPPPTDECQASDFKGNAPKIGLSAVASSGQIEITADVNAPYGVESVVFSVNGKEVSIVVSSPYRAVYALEGKTGNFEIKAEVTDKNGNKQVAATMVTVAEPVVVPEPPATP